VKTIRLLAIGITLCFFTTGCDKPAVDPGPKTPVADQAKTTPTQKPSDAPKAASAGVAPFAFPGAWEKDVNDGLTKLMFDYSFGGSKFVKGQPAPVVVVDFDNTLIKGDIGRAFFDFMVTEGKIQFTDKVVEALPEDKRAEAKAAWDTLQKLQADKRADSREARAFRKVMHKIYWSLCRDADAEKCYPWQVRFYAGYSPDELKTMAAQVMETELKQKMGSEQIRVDDKDQAPGITSRGIRIYEEMKDLLFHLDQRGFEIWVVSAGPQWVVEGAVTKHFAVKPGRVIGMRTKLADGKLTTEIEAPPTFRMGKVEAIDKRIGRKPLLAIGDSWSDADMLGNATHALLVDRGYLDLKKKAVESKWWIQPAFPVR